MLRGSTLFRGRLARLVTTLLDAIYPRRCVLCGSADDLGAEWPLCNPCLSREEVFGQQDRQCPRCAMPVDRFLAPDTPGGCRWCRSLRLGFDAASAGGLYAGRLRELVILYKYQQRLQLLSHLAALAAAGARRALDAMQPALLCPIPPARSRLAWRGYDPVAELAARAARMLSLPYSERVLERIRDTRPLAELSRRQRLEELAGAFAATGALDVSGKCVAVVDDILTTGATLSEAARVLKKQCGAARVLAIVVARTPDVPAV